MRAVEHEVSGDHTPESGDIDPALVRRHRAEERQRRAAIEEVEGELAASERSLTDALIDIGRQGSAVRIEGVGVPGAVWIDHVGLDVIGVIASTGDAEFVALSAVLGITTVPGERQARVVTTGHPRTVLALAREMVGSGEAVVLGRADGVEVRGVLIAANTSHVELDTSSSPLLIPLSAVARIRSLPRRSRSPG